MCEYYGLHLSLAKARQLAGTDMQGTNMLGLVQAAEVLGFEAVPLAGDSDQLEEACSAGEVIFPQSHIPSRQKECSITSSS